jgi:hypothetical protein
MSLTEIREAKDAIAIPHTYLAEFKKDPVDSLLKYGSLPQRARSPWFTEVSKIDNALVLADVVTGSKSELTSPKLTCRSLVGADQPEALLQGISPEFFCADPAVYWHVHVDLALGKQRQGDAAGIAVGRVVDDFLERVDDPTGAVSPYQRIVRVFEVPLVAQIIAPVGSQIFIGSVTELILQLRQLRGFNITSYSFDGFQSASASQELMKAGLITAGMEIDEHTGEITGLPKPYSVDRSPQPYRDLLEGVNEARVLLPKYDLLRKEMRELERVEPNSAPDHPIGAGSKDVADPVAGVVGYLSVFGHAELEAEGIEIYDRRDLEGEYELGAARDFGVPDGELMVEGEFGGFNVGMETGQINFNV